MDFIATSDATSQLKSTGNITVSAENDMNPQTLAAGLGFAAQQEETESGDEEVYGGALSYANVDLLTTAYVAGRADIRGR